MQTILSLALLLLIVQQNPQRNGEIVGIVSRTDTREPIPEVRITVQSGNTTRSAITDGSGKFSIKEVSAGEYAVRAEKQSYLPIWGERTTPDFAASTRVSVKPDQQSAVDSLTLIPAAAIEGVVFNSDSSPATGLIVEVLRRTYSPVDDLQWVPARGATTDDRGHFRVFGLGPGKYYLRVIRRPPIVAGAVVTATSVFWTPTTYFPGVLNGALASAIDIQAGHDANINLTIPQTNPYTVSGELVNSLPGQGSLPAVGLVLTRRDFGAPIDRSSSLDTLNLPAGSDGRFEINGVPAGSYELFAVWRIQSTNPSSSGPTLPSVARTTFEVSDRDIDNISLILRPGVDVTGKLTVLGDSSGFYLRQSSVTAGGETGGGGGGGGGIVGTMVSVNLRVKDGSAGQILPPRISGETFTFSNVHEGTYSLTVNVGGQRRTAYVADIRVGARSIYGENLVVGNVAPDPLEIVVNTNGATVPITVTGKTTTPPIVYLVPQGQYARNPNRYRSSSTDASGNVTVNSVPPGQYTIFAWEFPGVPFVVMDPEFLAKYGTRGVRVNISGGGPSANIIVPVVRIDPPW